MFIQVDPKKAAPQGKVRNYVESLEDYVVWFMCLL
jgi:hypothetical protein